MHIKPPNLTVDKNFKISKSKMADRGHLENKKFEISPKPFGRF